MRRSLRVCCRNWINDEPQSAARARRDTRQSLSAEQWEMTAMAAGGLEAMAVEPLARRLGVTKGGFYWHFANRKALMRAALELWARQETEDAIAGTAGIRDLFECIVMLFKQSNGDYQAGRLHLALAAASDDPVVNEVVQGVSERRLTYLAECYRALGLSARDAKLWPTFSCATYIGNQQIHHDAPNLYPTGSEFREYFKLMARTLILCPSGSAEAGPAEVPVASPLDGGRRP